MSLTWVILEAGPKVNVSIMQRFLVKRCLSGSMLHPISTSDKPLGRNNPIAPDSLYLIPTPFLSPWNNLWSVQAYCSHSSNIPFASRLWSPLAYRLQGQLTLSVSCCPSHPTSYSFTPSLPHFLVPSPSLLSFFPTS